MYTKTTSIQCSHYAEILRRMPSSSSDQFKSQRKRLKRKSIHELFVYDHSVYIQALSGIVGILFAHGVQDPPELFVLHRVVKIKPGVLFNIVPLSGIGEVEIQITLDAQAKTIQIPEYTSTQVQSNFDVDEIFAFYYSTKGNSYQFEGEQHPFWELTFVDNGELECVVEDIVYTLPPRSIMLFGPEQFHTQSTAKDKTVSYLTIMFSAKMDRPELLTNRVIHCSNDLYDAILMFMHHNEKPWLFRSDLLLSILKVILVYATIEDPNFSERGTINPMQKHYENELLNEITQYIKHNVHNSLTIKDICDKFALSRSSLQALFKKHLDISPKLHINNVKLDQSKILLKKSAYTVSQISDMMGYTSIHYFSRKFKQVYGISPSDYAKSINN